MNLANNFATLRTRSRSAAMILCQYVRYARFRLATIENNNLTNENRNSKPEKKHGGQQPKMKYDSGIGRNNVGMNRRLKMFEENEQFFPNDADCEDIENWDEPDIGTFDRSYDEHWKEVKKIEEKKSLYKMTAKHYKRPKLPNMLTYAEKQQIRDLSSTDPDTWTPEKLAESFPASPEIIKKVVESRMKLETAERIMKHDKVVEKNWNLLRKNRLEDISDEFKKHLKKFSDRRVSNYEQNDLKKFIVEKSSVKPPVGEFGNIIESYKMLNAKSNAETVKVKFDDEDNNDNKIQILTDDICMGKFLNDDDRRTHSGKIYTLKEYRQKLSNRKNLTELEKLILEREYQEMPSIVQKNQEDIRKRHNENEHQYVGVDSYSANTKVIHGDYNTSLQIFDSDHYPLRINIPKDARKKGATYKLRDCFYDENGAFLYRVPGFTD